MCAIISAPSEEPRIEDEDSKPRPKPGAISLCSLFFVVYSCLNDCYGQTLRCADLRVDHGRGAARRRMGDLQPRAGRPALRLVARGPAAGVGDLRHTVRDLLGLVRRA